MSCKSFVEPQIIEICEKIHSQRDSKPIPGGSPPDWVLCLSLSGLCGSSRRFRGFEAHRMLEELRIRILVFEPWGSASNPFSVHRKIENPKMLRMKIRTSDFDVKKCSKRPRDPHNRIRLEKLCPKVVSDRQNAGRMTSKRRFWHFCPIIENRALNVNLKWSPWIREGSRRDPRPFKVFHPNRQF